MRNSSPLRIAARRASGGDHRRPAGRRVAVVRELPGEPAHEAAERGDRDRLLRVRAQHGDAAGLRVHALRLRADDGLRQPAGPARVDVAVLVDERVVADVVPAQRVAVVTADRQDDARRLRLRVLVRADRVVEDRRLDAPVARGLARRAAAGGLVRAPGRPRDEVGLRRDPGRAGRGLRHVHVVQPPPWPPAAARAELELVGAAEPGRVAVGDLEPLAPLSAGIARAQLERPQLAGQANGVEPGRGRDHVASVGHRAVVAVRPRGDALDGRQPLLEVTRARRARRARAAGARAQSSHSADGRGREAQACAISALLVRERCPKRLLRAPNTSRGR